MHEVFPVVAGLLLGVAVLRISNRTLSSLALIVGSVVLGITATYISGEALISWEFVLIDIPLVFGSAVVAIVATTLWERRSNPALRH